MVFSADATFDKTLNSPPFNRRVVWRQRKTIRRDAIERACAPERFGARRRGGSHEAWYSAGGQENGPGLRAGRGVGGEKRPPLS